MNETDYNDLLYEKMQQEYDAFIAGLKLMSNEQVIDSAYEKVIKSDILIECENGRLDQKEAKALYLEKYPLDRIYQDWLKSDVSYMGMIHQLRHTFCTRFCENERDIKVIQEIMGHADISTTMDIYNEATMDRKKQSFANLEGKIKIV